MCKLASFVFDATYQRQDPNRPWSAMQAVVAGTPGLREEVRQLAASWRRPQLLRPSAAGAPRSANVLQVVFIKRTGRRKLANAAHPARVVDGAEWLGVRLAASLYTFGAGFAQDARRMREADVLVGSHGADLLNGLWMHAGATAWSKCPRGSPCNSATVPPQGETGLLGAPPVLKLASKADHFPVFDHSGASLVEVRGHLFTSSLGVWAAWYATHSAR